VGSAIAFTPCGAQALGAFSTTVNSQNFANCSMSFNTNDALGGTISITNNLAQPSFFCTTGCSVAGHTAFADLGAGPVKLDPNSGLNQGAFGMAVKSLTGATSDLSAADASADSAGGAGTAEWYPITAASQNVCHTSAPTAGSTCVLTLGGEADASQQSGSYSGQAALTATAN
jgi:hypothetical protein